MLDGLVRVYFLGPFHWRASSISGKTASSPRSCRARVVVHNSHLSVMGVTQQLSSAV